MDATDPIHVLQKSVEKSWNVPAFPNVYYTSKYVDFASPKPDADKEECYCILDFDDADKAVRTNCSAIWVVPVTIRAYDIAMEPLRKHVTALSSFSCPGEHKLEDSQLTLLAGNIVGFECGRVRYEQVGNMKAKAEFEIMYRLNLPMR